MSFEELNRKHQHIIQDIQHKISKYFANQHYLLQKSPTFSKYSINQSHHLISSQSCLNIFGSQTKKRHKEQRISSNKDRNYDNQQESIGGNARSQLTLKCRKNSIQLQKNNEQLLNQLDALKKRMGMLEKSSSCGAIASPKTTNSIKQQFKSNTVVGVKKFATEEGKSILKKKGKPPAAVAIKTRIK